MSIEKKSRENRGEVERELKLCDPLDLVLLLAIGPKPASHLQVQKRALLISHVLEVDSEAEPYKYGLYSETITEKLQDARNGYFINRKNNRYVLTPEGLCAYVILMDKLAVKKGEDISRFIEMLHKMREKDLLAITYYLFPESFKESEIKENVIATIRQYRDKGFLKARKEGEKIVLEVKA